METEKAEHIVKLDKQSKKAKKAKKDAKNEMWYEVRNNKIIQKTKSSINGNVYSKYIGNATKHAGELAKLKKQGLVR